MKIAENSTPSKSALSTDSTQILKVVPSTASQMEIWLSCQLGGKDANMAYNESISVRLQGDFTISYLKSAFQKVIQRHEGMRATFTPNGSQMIIFNSFHLPIRFRDISQLNDEKKAEFIKKHGLDTGIYEFDLIKGPLYVLEVIKINDKEHLLTFTGHHLIFDGWSLGLLLEEIGKIYSHKRRGELLTLPKEDKISDYVVQYHRLTNSSEIIKTKEFWKKRLSNPLLQFDLPIDFDRPVIRKLKSKRIEVPMSKSLLVKSKKFAMEKKVSYNLLLLSIFEVFLGEWSGKNDVTVGVPMAGQAILNKLNLIGHCVNLLPLRSQIDIDLTFEDYLQKRKVMFSDTLDHSLISFGSLLHDLQVKRDTSRIPLIPITFNLNTTNSNLISFDGLKATFISNPKSYANFEIIINLFGNEEEISVEWTYNESLFHESSIWEAGQKYNLLIEKIIEAPLEKLSMVRSFFDDKEIEADLLLQKELSQSSDLEPGNLKLLIERQVAAFPNKIAITCNADSLDYITLNKKANHLANYLIDKGVTCGDFVGVYLDRSCDLLVTILAIIKTGAAYQPIDQDIPIERAKFMITDSGAKFLITDLISKDWQDMQSNVLYIYDIQSAVCEYPNVNPTVAIQPDSPIYTIYTSGSTGNPKGVVLTHQNIFFFTAHACKQLGYNSDDQITGVTSVSFDISIMEVLMPFALGATLHLMDRYQRKDPKKILALLEEKQITKMFATPTHWQMMVHSGWNKKLPNLTAIAGGEELKRTLTESLGNLTEEIWNVYGPTETTIFSTCKKINSGDQIITLGKAVEGTKIYLVDEKGNLVDQMGVSGEIWISGEGVGKNYIGLKELTADRFISNPFSNDGSRIYKTGDLGHWDSNGELNFLGRIDQQVKIRGYRVELGEIEQRLILFPEIEYAIVATNRDEEEIDTLNAYVSIRKDFELLVDKFEFSKKVKMTLFESLPEYMVPAQIFFLDVFPLTTSGKIDRKEVVNLARSYEEKSSKGTDYKILDLTEDQKNVLNIWKSVLKKDLIGLDDDFFLLGGHSLLGVRVISLLESEFGVSLSLLTLFQFPTIRGIIDHILSLKEEDNDTLVLIKKGSPFKVLCFVHGVGLNPVEINTLVNSMDEDQTIWGLQSPAISGTHEALQSIEEMAALYIKELDKQNVKRPYNLIGNSLGGLIVFEMAKQLLGKNREVGFIAMIDTVAAHSKELDLSLSQNIKRKVSKLKFELDFFRNDPSYYIQYRKRYIQEMWNKNIGVNEKEYALSYRIQKIEETNEQAWINYNLNYVDIKITLFLASRRTFYVKDFKTLGWEDLSRKVETIVMPGEHANMLKPPYGAEFTKCLQRELNHYGPI